MRKTCRVKRAGGWGALNDCVSPCEKNMTFHITPVKCSDLLFFLFRTEDRAANTEVLFPPRSIAICPDFEYNILLDYICNRIENKKIGAIFYRYVLKAERFTCLRIVVGRRVSTVARGLCGTAGVRRDGAVSRFFPVSIRKVVFKNGERLYTRGLAGDG